LSNPDSTNSTADETFDKEGFLRDLDSWNEEVAASIAARCGIDLGEAHWEIIYLLRDFYEAHQLSPANRALVSLVKRELGSDKGNSAYLMGLFKNPDNNKESPAKLASKIAGLPKPENCL